MKYNENEILNLIKKSGLKIKNYNEKIITN